MLALMPLNEYKKEQQVTINYNFTIFYPKNYSADDFDETFSKVSP